jgi:hypothetical protein
MNQPEGVAAAQRLELAIDSGGASLNVGLMGGAAPMPLALSTAATLYLRGGQVVMDPIGTANALMSLNKTQAGASASIMGSLNGLYRWGIYMGNGAGEGGGNTGSQLTISRFSDAGGWIGDAVVIDRDSGQMQVTSTSQTGLTIYNPQTSGSYATLRLNAQGQGGKQIRVGAGNFLEFVNSANTAIVTNMSDTGAWTGQSFTPSDEKLKKDIAPLPDAHEGFMAIQPIRYRLLADDKDEQWGFSSQNLQRALPSVVPAQDPNHFNIDGSLMPLAFSHVGVLAVTVAEVQALIQRVQQLESQA